MPSRIEVFWKCQTDDNLLKSGLEPTARLVTTLGSYERLWSPGSVTESVSLLPAQFHARKSIRNFPTPLRGWHSLRASPPVIPTCSNNTVNNPNRYIENVNHRNPIADISGRVDYQLRPTDIFYTRYQYGTVFDTGEVSNLVNLDYCSDNYVEPGFGFTFASVWNDGIL